MRGETTYRGVGLNRAVEGHQRAALLRNLCVLAMESALLVLLHPSNLLFQSDNANLAERVKPRIYESGHTVSLPVHRGRCRPSAPTCQHLSSRLR